MNTIIITVEDEQGEVARFEYETGFDLARAIEIAQKAKKLVSDELQKDWE